MKKFVTSESVTEGHPDKVCDLISDAILDELLRKDTEARVACETCTTTGLVLVMGEVTTNTYVDVKKVVKDTLREIGYSNSKYGIDADTCAVLTSLEEQSKDIAMGVDASYESRHKDEDPYDLMGAGDQGMVFGYATNETQEYMPLALVLSHKMAKKLSEIRKDGTVDYLRPDGKSQVTIEYNDGKVSRIDSIVISAQHNPDVSQDTIEADIRRYVIEPIVDSSKIDKNTKIYINPTGKFVIGGPLGDAGLTGRKIIVDTYGGFAHHGGGAFSGKDPTKVDRSAAYLARYIAKNIVKAELADVCEVGLAYAIGVAKPLSISVDTKGTGKVSEDKIIEIIKKVFDCRPKAIIDHFDLKRPIYRQTAAYGHFGRDDLNLPWENTDKVDEIKEFLS